MGELQHCLRLLGLVDPAQPPPVHVAGTGRKGGGGKRGGKPCYRPVPASGHHNMGNRNFTCRQAGAAKHVHKHCANAASVDDWSAHQDWSASPDFEFAPSCFRMVLQAPAKFRNAMKKELTFSIIWDSGASISISPNKGDFIGPSPPPVSGLV
jgi:hypothetical protein